MTRRIVRNQTFGALWKQLSRVQSKKGLRRRPRQKIHGPWTISTRRRTGSITVSRAVAAFPLARTGWSTTSTAGEANLPCASSPSCGPTANRPSTPPSRRSKPRVLSPWSTSRAAEKTRSRSSRRRSCVHGALHQTRSGSRAARVLHVVPTGSQGPARSGARLYAGAHRRGWPHRR